MDQPNRNNHINSSGDIPLRRKRGRPRKYPKPYGQGNAHIPNLRNVNQNPVGGGNAGAPPGFDRFNGSQPHRMDLGNNSNDPMIGQVVSCVIEAVFDAGYLLSAKVGNSNTTLRGLVLRPGHYAPVSAENDVAPGVPMIQRIEVPFSTGTSVQKPRRRERNKHHINIHRNVGHTVKGSAFVSQSSSGAVSSANLVASRGKNQQSMEKQTNSLLSRGNVVPVTLQPVSAQNGVMVSNQVMTQASLGSTLSVAKEIPADGNQIQFSQTLTSQNLLPRGMRNEDGLSNLSSAEAHSKVEAKSSGPPGMPFENLVTEVIRRVDAPSESIDTTNTNNSKSVEKMSIKDSGSGHEEKAKDVGQPLLIEPLQAVQTVSQEHSASASRPSGNSEEAGKMIDQSQILQDNRIENQPLEAAELVSGNKSDGKFKAETDEKTGQSA